MDERGSEGPAGAGTHDTDGTAPKDVPNGALDGALDSRLRKISAILQDIGSSFDPMEVQERVLSELIGLFDIQAAFLMLADPESGTLRMERYAGKGKRHLGSVELRRGEGVIGRAFDTGRSVYVSSLHARDDVRFPERVRAAGVSDLWVIPLEARGDRLGVLGLFLPPTEDGSPSGDDRLLGGWERDLIQLFARHVAVAIQNARLHDDSLRRLGLTKTVVEQAPAAIALVASDSMLVLEANARLQGLAGRAAVIGRAAVEVLEPVLAWVDGVSASEVLEEAVAHGHSRFFPAVRMNREGGRHEHWDIIVDPVVFTPSGPQYVLVSAVEVTEQVRLRQRLEQTAAEERHRSSQLIVLNQLAVTLNSEADTGRMLDEVLRGAAHITGASSGAFYLSDASGGLRLEAFASGPEPADARESWRSGGLGIRSLAARAIEERRLLRLSEEADDASGGFHGYLAVPLVTAEGEALGGFVLTGTPTGHGFSAEHEMLASTLGAHVTVALQNLMQLREERETVEHLQRALLPRVADVPGMRVDVTYESATEASFVGGDFYDVFVCDDGRVCLCVGDVCGKGLSAATNMAMVRHVVRAYASLRLGAGEWLGLVNENAAPMMDAGFATAALALLDPENGEVEYALAGHPPPYLLTQGRADELERARGLPLGIRRGEAFESLSFSMTPGDRLVLFTDGLYEARSEAGLFGMLGLGEAAADRAGGKLKGAAERLVGAARDFSGGRLGDDVVVLVAEMQDTMAGDSRIRDSEAFRRGAAPETVAPSEETRS